MSDEGNRWEEVRWPRWEVEKDLKAKKSWMRWMGVPLEGRKGEKEGMGVGWEREKKEM